MEDIQRQIDMLPEDFLIPCDVEGTECDERFETLEQLQEHKHAEHRMFYLYECEECRTEYVCEYVAQQKVTIFVLITDFQERFRQACGYKA